MSSPTGDSVGISAHGREQRARIMFGKSTAVLLTAIRDETSTVMAGGYKRGAGSNDDGSVIGILLDGLRYQ